MRLSTLSIAMPLLTACGQSEPAEATIGNDIAISSTMATQQASPARSQATAPSSTGTTAPPDKSVDDSNSGVVKVLYAVLLPVGQLNGVPITAVQRTSRCVTVFSTEQSDSAIDWTNVPDWLSRNENGRVTIPIASKGQTYIFTMPQAKQPEPVGDAGATVESAFGSLADSCGNP